MEAIKKVCLFVAVLATIVSCRQEEDEYLIVGDLRCVRENTAYLLKMNEMGELFVVDSVPIRAGKFKFKGTVDAPEMRFVRIGMRPPFEVFVENSRIEITGSVTLPDGIEVAGSFSHDDFETLSDEYKKIVDKQSSLMVRVSNARDHQDKKEIRRLLMEYNSYPDSMLHLTKQFVLNNPSSYGAAYFVCQLAQTYDVSQLEEIVNLFHSSMKESSYLQYLKGELKLNEKLLEGMPADPFLLPTFDFKDTVSLADYAGKYLFIDFGASWCVSTSSRLLNLEGLKNKMTGKNFDVVSIFLDDDRRMISEYVEDIGLQSWKVLCDYRYWESPVTKSYRVQTIPYGVLISPDGKIALKNPTFKELRKFLLKNAR